MKEHPGAIALTCVLTIASPTLPQLSSLPVGSGEEPLEGETAPPNIAQFSRPSTNQIIIQYKAASAAAAEAARTERMTRLNQTAGMSMRYVRAMSGDAHVLRLPAMLPREQVEAIAARLMALREVEYAEPDDIVFPTSDVVDPAARTIASSPVTTPNDPEYARQWDFSDVWGINTPVAWDITTGSASVVVAVIDTGMTNHADLSGRTVKGYDFIDDPPTANDGDGRDGDPSDPGDWVTEEESETPDFEDCDVRDSSWHGTHVAGTIGAASNNGLGVAGICWNAKILPVRVLGKCGGYVSDIADGMRWAAGLSVPGAPANKNPAKVLNLSLGGLGPCYSTYQNAINDVTAVGAVVVVAAGNSARNASGFSPANCKGIITVAATDIFGYKAPYSNYGSTIEISAPGGNLHYKSDPAGILSTLNTGTQGPVADTYTFYNGTSMATPHVSGVAALIFSLRPNLTPSNVLKILQSTAKAFPAGGSCTTSNCGRGIVDAGAAVQSAASLPPARTFMSAAAQDGWILESSETSGQGGSTNTTTTTLLLGDDGSNRQYRAFLSFDTSKLPDTAVISSAVLQIKQTGTVTGTSPFDVLGALQIDAMTGWFGSNSGLVASDFEAAATAPKAGSFSKTPANGWYYAALKTNGLGAINKTGLTQLRLWFATDDNNNSATDLLKFVSGNASKDRPTLVINYTLP